MSTGFLRDWGGKRSWHAAAEDGMSGKLGQRAGVPPREGHGAARGKSMLEAEGE